MKIIINNVIYDITTFIHEHPGGPDVFHGDGKDSQYVSDDDVIKKNNGGWGSETSNASYTSENDFVGFASLSVCISSSQTL